MKCENCGADFSAKELQCPFCGTVNPTGVKWTEEEAQARNQVEHTRKMVIRSAPLYVANRVVNRILAVFLVLAILLFAGTFVAFWIEEKVTEHRQSTAVFSEAEALRQAGDYQGLKEYLDFHDADGSNGSPYAVFYEAVYLHEEIDDFMAEWMRYSQYDQAYFEEYWEYGAAENMLERCAQILQGDYYRFRADYAENAELMEELQHLCKLFLISEFGYDEADIQRLMETSSYDDAFADVIVREAYERKGWEYGKSDGQE